MLHEIVVWQNVTSDPASKASCSGQRCTMWGSTLSSGGSPASMPCCAFSSRVSPHANCNLNFDILRVPIDIFRVPMIEDNFLKHILQDLRSSCKHFKVRHSQGPPNWKSQQHVLLLHHHSKSASTGDVATDHLRDSFRKEQIQLAGCYAGLN